MSTYSGNNGNGADRNEVAHRLAEAHFHSEPSITNIYRLIGPNENDADEPIKLLEVNQDTVPGGIQPIYFSAHPASGIMYPSAVVDVTPEEFERIQRNELNLPTGWTIGDPFPSPPERRAS
jgi:hypothetical protein